MKQWVFVSSCLFGLVAGSTTLEAAKPNIVFILADDLGWTDLGCFGSKYYETPNIDRLAQQGMRFTSAYSNGPNCAPTRACLMSGRYTPRHGIYTVGTGTRGKEQFRKMIPVENKTVLSTNVVTIAERLQAAGYTTAHMGKWHLGNPPQAGPNEQGFDLNVAGDRRGSPPTYFSPYRNTYLEDGPKGEYLTDRLTDEAVKFIGTKREKPFFLYLAHYAVHTPIQAKKSLIDKYKKKDPSEGHSNPTYAAMIHSLDESVGRILDKLDELKLAENTVVIFTSDNGGLGGYHALNLFTRDVTSNAPLKGGKGMLYEGGIRVSTIVRWPGVTKPGTLCNEPIVTLDFYPTLMELAGIESKPADQLDGLSIVGLLKSGGDGRLKREALYWHFPGYLQANQNRGTWRTTPGGIVRQGDYKLIEFFEEGRLELYNLKDDLSERHNLTRKMPEKTRELHRLLAAWRKSVNAPMPKRK
ncbi:MAG: sulfatase [Planctomycetes bacterium]|nr:sulfatase [Planctomycetota bacterium]